MQAVAESVALGSRLGLPRDLLFDTLARIAVVAPAHAGKLASAKRSEYAPQFPVRLMQKDSALILKEAARLKLWMPATEAAAAINAAESASGRQEERARASVQCRAPQAGAPRFPVASPSNSPFA
jgi:3-hydroxyisobutyrate dehydrogenase-like beta-hydroxyacid dehydrogenase